MVLKSFPAFLTNDTVNTIFTDTVQIVLFVLWSQSKVKLKIKLVFCECKYSHLYIEEIFASTHKLLILLLPTFSIFLFRYTYRIYGISAKKDKISVN